MRNFLKSRQNNSLRRKTSNRTVTWSYSHVSMLNGRWNLHIKRNLTPQDITETLQILDENYKKKSQNSRLLVFIPQYPHILPKPRENVSPFTDRPVESWDSATSISFICWTLLWLTCFFLPRHNIMVLQEPLTDLAPLKALPKHLTKSNLYYLCASVRHFHCNYLVPTANISVNLFCFPLLSHDAW